MGFSLSGGFVSGTVLRHGLKPCPDTKPGAVPTSMSHTPAAMGSLSIVTATKVML